MICTNFAAMQLSSLTGIKRNRRGTSFIHVTAEAMARRKEKEREKRERYRPFRISDDFNEIAHSFDLTGKHHYSATNINALLRKSSSPSYRGGQYGLHGYRNLPESPSKPLLRRCQTSRPIRPSRLTRIDTGESAPRWRQNKNRTRKSNKNNIMELNLEDYNTKRFDVDFLKVEEAVAVMNSTSSEKSSPSSTRNRLDSDTGNKSTGSRSHSVIVFVENSSNHDQGTLGDIVESQPLSKTKSLEIRRKRRPLSSDEEKKELSVSPILKRISCDDGVNSQINISKSTKCDQVSSNQGSLHTFDRNFVIEKDQHMKESTNSELLSHQHEGANGSLHTINVYPKAPASAISDSIFSASKESREEKEDLCDTDSSIELQTYLGGNIESSI